MASVHKRVRNENATWRVVWSELGHDGKRQKRNKSFNREKDAKTFRATIELDAENKGVGDPAKRTTLA